MENKQDAYMKSLAKYLSRATFNKCPLNISNTWTQAKIRSRPKYTIEQDPTLSMALVTPEKESFLKERAIKQLLLWEGITHKFLFIIFYQEFLSCKQKFFLERKWVEGSYCHMCSSRTKD